MPFFTRIKNPSGSWVQPNEVGPQGATGPKGPTGSNSSNTVWNKKTVTGSYSATGTDHVIFTNGSSITVTLPASDVDGRTFTVSNIGSATADVDYGASNWSLPQGSSVTFVYDGSVWREVDLP